MARADAEGEVGLRSGFELAESGHALGEMFGRGGVRHDVEAELDHPVEVSARWRGGVVSDKGSPAHLAEDQAALLGDHIGLGHGSDAKPESERQFALRRQTGPGRENARSPVALERRNQFFVEGAWTIRQSRLPVIGHVIRPHCTIVQYSD